MTDLLDRAFAFVRELPPQQQDRLARIMLAAAEDDSEPYQLTSEEEVALAEGIAAADRNEFASDDEVRSTFAKYGIEFNPTA